MRFCVCSWVPLQLLSLHNMLCVLACYGTERLFVDLIRWLVFLNRWWVQVVVAATG